MAKGQLILSYHVIFSEKTRDVAHGCCYSETVTHMVGTLVMHTYIMTPIM